MKILLLGSTGRLGQQIYKKFFEQKTEFEAVTRDHTASYKAFKTFIEKQKLLHQTLLILDVSLPSVTHEVAKFLLSSRSSVSSRGLTAGSSCSSMDPVVKPRGDTLPRDDKAFFGLIIGTTGHTDECLKELKKLSAFMPIGIVPNFSKAIFLLNRLLSANLLNGETMASLAKKFGFTISLEETHHQHKKDAPSGTALFLSCHLDIDPKSITSVRTGEVIGEHTIILNGQNETMKILHSVNSRSVFAEGACDVSLEFLKKRLPPGLYSLSNIW